MSSFSDLKDAYREWGPLRFSLFMGGMLAVILAWAAIYMWLSAKTGWPDAYGFHCTGRGCMFSHLLHSPRLLPGANIYELALFAFIWALPSFLVGCLTYAYLIRRRRIRSRRNRILPLDRS